MAIRGQKVHIDLDDHGPVITEANPSAPAAAPSVSDIRERSITSEPTAPSCNKTQNGFPTHKTRTASSRFKQARAGITTSVAAEPRPATTPSPADFETEQKRQIDHENRIKLESMSAAEIQQERQELLNSMDPSLLQALLRRAEFKPQGDDADADFPGIHHSEQHQLPEKVKSNSTSKRVAFAEDAEHPSALDPPSAVDEHTSTLRPAQTALSADNTHFPKPEQPPPLDPSSDTFLDDLHQKYFPTLPSDPDKLAWMRPSTVESSYSPSQSGLNPKDIRFDFAGTLIPPSTAAEIPVTAGLHHHGDAPDAAGYTIPELARLARSAVPAQRCVAFQTLGRLLYRLGKGEFGNPSDGKAGTLGVEETRGELARGLWREVEKERVVDICTAESEGHGLAGGKHVSAQAYATEAVWLWQKGGGRRYQSA